MTTGDGVLVALYGMTVGVLLMCAGIWWKRGNRGMTLMMLAGAAMIVFSICIRLWP